LTKYACVYTSTLPEKRASNSHVYVASDFRGIVKQAGWWDWVDAGISFIPVVGTAYNAGKSIYYLTQGDYARAAENALYAGAGLVGMGGAAKLGKAALKGGKALYAAAKGAKTVGNVAKGTKTVGNVAKGTKALATAGKVGVNAADDVAKGVTNATKTVANAADDVAKGVTNTATNTAGKAVTNTATNTAGKAVTNTVGKAPSWLARHPRMASGLSLGLYGLGGTIPALAGMSGSPAPAATGTPSSPMNQYMGSRASNQKNTGVPPYIPGAAKNPADLAAQRANYGGNLDQVNKYMSAGQK
jgi:hypothetical protein